MQRRKFSREFKVEAVKLVRERGVSVAQASRDLGVHENVLRKWVKEFGSDPVQAFPGHGQMKPEQLRGRFTGGWERMAGDRSFLVPERKMVRSIRCSGREALLSIRCICHLMGSSGFSSARCRTSLFSDPSMRGGH